MPLDYLVSVVARRWHTTPMAVREAPWADVQRELGFMEAESRAQRRPPP